MVPIVGTQENLALPMMSHTDRPFVRGGKLEVEETTPSVAVCCEEEALQDQGRQGLRRTTPQA